MKTKVGLPNIDEHNVTSGTKQAQVIYHCWFCCNVFIRSENYSNKLLQDYCNGTTTSSRQPHFSTPGISGIESMVPASSGWNSTIPTMKYQSSPSRFHELTYVILYCDKISYRLYHSRPLHHHSNVSDRLNVFKLDLLEHPFIFTSVLTFKIALCC